MIKKWFFIFFITFSLLQLTGCTNAANGPQANHTSSDSSSDTVAATAAFEEDSFKQEAAALEEGLQPAQNYVIHPEASGTLTEANDYACVDYSNTKDGYVMVQYTASSDKKLKSQIVGPTTTYTYNLTPQQWEVFPLSDGNGEYQINIFENIEGTRYLQILSSDISVTLEDEFAPFIRPNQYVNYENAENTIKTAASLTGSTTDALEKVTLIYDYVINNISYDTEKAQIVKSGYLPDLDSVLAAKKGICFDYASLMAGMLRSQGVPCKLIVGYAGTVYHAWLSVWSEETGWIDGVVFFNGISWQRMDPTYAATDQMGTSTQEFIENNDNYTSKYIY